MSLLAPWMLAVAALAGAAGLVGYRLLDRQRTAALAAAGLVGARAHRLRHLPYLLLWLGVVTLFAALARPVGTVAVPRLSSTVVLAIDVSSSMTAGDVAPDRLGAARAAARELVDAQPAGVDIGVVTFGEGALAAQLPTSDRDAVRRAVDRVSAGGGTSLGEAVVASLGMITGQPVTLPAPGDPVPDLGRWETASVVVISDGEQTSAVDPLAAADLAAAAGVRIETLGIGTAAGTVIEVDGYRIATRLDEARLEALAESTGGGYHRAGEDGGVANVVDALGARFRLEDEEVELTAVVAGLAVLLLTAGGLVMIARTGRVL
ncbi:MAG: VWA domain-containing protein [Propionicimonas sp.]|nr:VWA domain-containing protein [Propionicimonas sp.]